MSHRITERLAELQALESSSAKGVGKGLAGDRQVTLGESLASRRAKGLFGKDESTEVQDGSDLSAGGESDGIDYDAARRAIMRDILEESLGAGGMASVGAVNTILSWASSELERTGELHPETAAIVRETLERALDWGLLDEETVAKFRERFFPQDS